MIRQLPFLLVLAAAVVAIPPFGSAIARAARRLSRPLVVRPAMALTLLFFATFALAATVSLVVFMPLPRIHDEFSHLLAADTFRHARLTNPPNPAWQSLETFHELQQPTYMSRYSPAPGMFLALGWIVTGMPIAGAWLAYALACVAVAWMLMAFMPRRWALFGALLLAVHPVMFGWSQTFWGGSVAVLGGALVAGSAGRLRRADSPGASVLGGVGLFFLANSRPFEGFAFALVVLCALVAERVRRRGWSPRRNLALAPMLAFGLLTLAFVAWYDWRVTGDPLLLPHRAYGRQYAPSPIFVGGTPAPAPAYRHEVMKTYHLGGEMSAYALQTTTRGKWLAFVAKLVMLSKETFALPLAFLPGQPPTDTWLPGIALLGLPFALGRSKRARRVAVWFVAFIGACVLVLWMQPQYAAPGVCLAAFLIAASVRSLRLHWRRAAAASAMTSAFFVLMLASLAAGVAMIPRLYGPPFDGAVLRERILGRLETLPGRDLVIVRYAPDHFVHFEWVYNEADVDGSEVVWARQSAMEINAALLSHFRGRRIWLLEADERPPMLREVRLESAETSDPASR